MSHRTIQLNHFYYGNPFGAGQGVPASSYSVSNRTIETAQNNWMLGRFVDEPRWREIFTEFSGTGFYSYKNGATFAFLQKIAEGDPRLPYLYHWVIVPRADIIALSGHWHHLTEKVREQDKTILTQFQRGSSVKLSQIELAIPENDDEIQQSLRRYFPPNSPQHLMLLEQLLTLALTKEKVHIGARELAINETEREAWIIALNLRFVHQLHQI